MDAPVRAPAPVRVVPVPVRVEGVSGVKRLLTFEAESNLYRPSGQIWITLLKELRIIRHIGSRPI